MSKDVILAVTKITAEDWFDNMSEEAQLTYLEEHPNSKQAKHARSDEGAGKAGESPHVTTKMTPKAETKLKSINIHKLLRSSEMAKVEKHLDWDNFTQKELGGVDIVLGTPEQMEADWQDHTGEPMSKETKNKIRKKLKSSSTASSLKSFGTGLAAVGLAITSVAWGLMGPAALATAMSALAFGELSKANQNSPEAEKVRELQKLLKDNIKHS